MSQTLQYAFKLLIFFLFTFLNSEWLFKLCQQLKTEAVTGGVLQGKMFLEISQNLQEKTFARVCFIVNFIEKETLAQIFSYEFCKIFKGTVMEMKKGLINDRLRVSKVS